MKQDFGKYAQEPVWLGRQRLRRDALPDAWRHWLLDPSSLTRRLQKRCHGNGFNVRVISQRMELPLPGEARALGRPLREVALVRQVYLQCHETPWVFARTVVPLPSLKGGLRRLAMLDTQPLGTVLFADPQMQRGPVEVAHIGPGQRLFRADHGKTTPDRLPIWARRSVFCLQDRPLLVSDFFLPELLEQTAGAPCR